MKDKRIISIFILLGVIIAILGGTLAYWSWNSSNEQKTNITFTAGANFSCSADGGGNITNTNYFAPTDCTNSTYAIQRPITTSITNNGSSPVYLDMWLNINSIGSGLSSSNNFKYALTTSSSSCTTGVITEGNFNGKAANDKIELLSGVTTASTYYLYIWLDSAETSSSTQNQSVSLSLGGECVDYKPLNGTIYRMSTEVIGIGDSLAPVTQQKWCAVESQYGTIHNCFDTESECNEWNTTATFNGQRSCTYMTITTGVTDYETDVNNISSNYFLRHQVVNDIVTESYIGFRITPAMVSANSNLTAGTYYLRGGTGGSSYNSNLATLQTAFGTNGCSSGPAISYCSATGLSIIFNSTDWVQAGPGSITENCQIHDDAVGRSECIIGS